MINEQLALRVVYIPKSLDDKLLKEANKKRIRIGRLLEKYLAVGMKHTNEV